MFFNKDIDVVTTSFQPVMRTTLPNETIYLPMTTTSPVVIDWGDGIVETKSAPFGHTYATAGDYHIKVKITASREITNFRFAGGGDRGKLIDIKNWGWVKLSGGSNLSGCINVEEITAQDVPEGLTNLTAFFYGMIKLKRVNNLENWDLSQVLTSNIMFYNCIEFNQEINFNMPLNTTCSEMFRVCNKLNSNITLNIPSCTNLAAALANCAIFNQPVILSNLSSLTTMSAFMFGTGSYNTTNTDNLLISLASQTTANNVNCSNAFRPRTSASNSAVATLQSRGWTGLV
jgi:hypothetical protein